MTDPRPWYAYLLGPEWAGLRAWVEEEMKQAARAAKGV